MSKIPNGTGFFVGRCSRELPHLWHIYAVSNQHVVIESPSIRINTKNGSTRLLEYNPDQWTISEKDDLAIIDVTDDLAFDMETLVWSDDISWVHELDLLRHDNAGGRAYVGDDTVMLGLFADSAGGGKVNLPVARFGNLAAFADDNVPIGVGPGDRFYRPAFLNDTRSRSGFSGSPVWAWYSPYSDVRTWENERSPGLSLLSRARRSPDLCLIGVHRAQFREEVEVIGGKIKTKLKEANIIEIASSMTIVVPAWEIQNLLEKQHFELRRKKRDETKERRAASFQYERIARAQEIIPPPPLS